MTTGPPRRLLSRVVQLVVIVVVVGLVALVVRSQMPRTRVGESCPMYTLFRDAQRIAVGSPVMIAGVRIGEVERLSIDGALARVDMRLQDDVAIPVDSWITKRAESAFGDSYLEIVPGDAPAHLACTGPEQRIVRAQEGASTDTYLRAIARTMPKIDRGLDTVHDFALDTRRWANSTLEPAIDRIDRWLAAGNLDKPIERIDRGAQNAADSTESAQRAVHDAVPTVARGLKRADEVVASARKNIADFKKGLQDALGNAREGIDRVDPTIRDIKDVVEAVDEGRGSDFKGSLGRLINDRDFADTLDDLSEGAADAVAGFVRFKSYLGLRVELDLISQVPRVYVSAEERVREDKFYLVEVEKDTLGGLPTDQLAESPGVGPYTRYQSIPDTLRFTFQFGKTFWHRVQLRGGIKESTFGFGADGWVLNQRLKLSADLYGSFQITPRLKLTAALRVFRSIYVLAGVDDALNSPGSLPVVTGTLPTGGTPPPQAQLNRVPFGRDVFIGAALHFDDADLSALIRIYGALVVGLLAAHGG